MLAKNDYQKKEKNCKRSRKLVIEDDGGIKNTSLMILKIQVQCWKIHIIGIEYTENFRLNYIKLIYNYCINLLKNNKLFIIKI